MKNMEADKNEAPDPADLYVGTQLRLRRNLMGMSQEQLGKATGLTFQQIQKYERGTNRIAASRLFYLSRLLNVSVEYFFKGFSGDVSVQNPGFSGGGQEALEGSPASNQDDEILQRREVKELIRAYDRIKDPKQRRIVYDLAKSMATDSE